MRLDFRCKRLARTLCVVGSFASILVCGAMISTSDAASGDAAKVSFHWPKQAPENYWTKNRRRIASSADLMHLREADIRAIAQRYNNRNSILYRGKPTAVGTPTNADVTMAPYKAAGRLFFDFLPSHDACTAQFVGDSQVVLTAAHCIQDPKTKKYATSILFHRAYYLSTYAQRIGIECIGTPTNWADGKKGKPEYDYAFLKTKTASSGGYIPLRSVTPRYPNTWEAIGYSKYGKYEILQKVTGALGRQVGGIVQMKNNPLGDGSSGGAWLDRGFVFGDVSGSSTMPATDSWSPVYDTNVQILFNRVKNGCK
jgi:Trypsin-like peptidase domain